MKKVFSLILAVAMVLSLASVAFANTTDNQSYILSSEAKNVNGSYGYVSQLMKVQDKNFVSVTSLVFGQTYYYPIMATTSVAENPDNAYETSYLATYAKQLGSMKIAYEFTEGAEYVKNVSLKQVFVEKDVDEDGATGNTINRNVWTIAIETTGGASKKQNIVGSIKVTGTPGAGTGKGIAGVTDNKNIDTKISIDTSINYEVKDLTSAGYGVGKTISGGYVTNTDATTVNFKSVGTTDGLNKVKVTTAGTTKKYTFNGTSIVATLEEAKALEGALVTFDTYEIADVVASNPDAAIMFYNLTCNFQKSAEVEIDPIDEEGDNYLYQILPSGATKNLTSTYSVDDEKFMLTARKLTGTYIVSDMPLVF